VERRDGSGDDDVSTSTTVHRSRAAGSLALPPDHFLPGSTPAAVVNRLLDHAAGVGASDLFLSTEEADWSVSVRQLGVVHPVCRLSMDFGRHCAAHLRAEAGMDIAEHRRPQDGRWIHRTPPGRVLDLRICSLPTLHGEDISVRLLDRETCLLRLDRIGLLPADRGRVDRLLGSPGGLILVAGPTGSGKSTTLYACLQHLNDGHRRIHTIEDPIEYAIEGIHQSQVNPKMGIHFAELLRGIVRQGPDVIMVGEIRDPETAQTAVYAGNSGHLVLATLHASLAAGSVQSMLAFGVSPHFLATSLIGAVSQRLVRTFCPECRFASEVGEAPVAGPGCPRCHHTGFGGRTAVFEVLEVTEAVRGLIQAREPAQAIEEQAYRDGMTGFRRAAEELVARGVTDLAEVSRCIPPECLRGREPRPASRRTS
jgi:type II secretory ATPase GspE/PulE/Tfp pilus assembly ATPase PilB-like protein